MQVPARFADELIGREGPSARAWLDAVPGLVRGCCHAWGLDLDGPVWHGYTGLVLPATRHDGTPAVLKISRLDPDTRDEPVALSTWDGAGAVLLLDSAPEHGALLLERLDPDRTLMTEPLDNAVEIAAGLLRRLAVPAPASLRHLRDESARLAETLPSEWARLGKPLPRRLLDHAMGMCRELGPDSGSSLVNQDLHYENVLAGRREPWLVIDPQPLAGDPEFGVIPLLWNRSDESIVDVRFAAVVARAGLDAGRATGWTLVRAVDTWLWSLEAGGFPPADGLAEIARWAAGPRPG